MLVSLPACNELPAQKVVETEGGVVVEVKRLGEYPSAVARVRLTRTEDGERLWEVESAEGASTDIWEIPLERGWNDAATLGPRFRTLFPIEGQFFIETDAEYRLEIWGGATWKRRAVEFVMPGLPSNRERFAPGEREGTG